MLLSAPYLLAASICTYLVTGGGPGWLNILVLPFIWNAIKFLIMGRVSVVLLVQVRVQETAGRRRALRQQSAMEPVAYAEAGVA